MSATKSERINLRATEKQEHVLRRAAEAEDVTVSTFILGSAVEQAEKVLADRRWFEVTPEQFEEFVQLLDQPVKTEKLAALFARPSVFDAPFTLED
ncbi:DUF1778 domain-containing protein [Brachybacterium tyrofermentans]|uniref:DUF1778 domain-containing protein n=1 Tax=Brachybacterium tyrofermentans TaxID=47848 RepID=A0ABW0FF54_9MICO